MRMKRMKATRIGSRLLSLAIALLWFAGVIQAKKDKPEATQPFALIAGTVFRPPGLALAGVTVVISPESTESGNGKLKKIAVNGGAPVILANTVNPKAQAGVRTERLLPPSPTPAASSGFPQPGEHPSH